MRKIIFFIGFILCISLNTKAQSQDTLLVYKTPTDAIDTVICGGKDQKQYRKIAVYTTNNQKWNGIKDSLCYGLVENTNWWTDWSVSVDSSFTDQYIFIADTSVNLEIKKDSIYSFFENTWRVNCRVREYIAIMLIEKYDTAKKGFIIDTVNITNKNEYCLCGNKFNGKIKAFIVGIKPYDITSGAIIFAQYQIFMLKNTLVIQDSIHAVRMDDSAYYVELNYNNGNYRNVVFSNPNSNPLNDDIHIIEIYPAGEPTKKSTITLSTWQNGVFFQPYTELRGSIYDTLTGDRHQLLFELEETNLCITPLVELVIDDGNIFKYKSGKIALHGRGACIMIKDQATFIVAENSHLIYGIDGEGILGLRPGAKFLLEKNATITINNMLFLADYWENPQGGELNITLKQGNELIFGKDAWLSNGPFLHGSVMLNLHLKGGKVDISQLNESSKSLINIIDYSFDSKIIDARVYPNPSTGTVYIDFISDETSNICWQIFSSTGSLVLEGQFYCNTWNNKLIINVKEQQSGLYFIKMQQDEHIFTKSVILTK